MDEEIEISYTCTNLPSNSYDIAFSRNHSINGFRVSPETVLDGVASRTPYSGESSSLNILWGDHFFQNTFSNMTTSGRVNFSPTEFSFGEYLASGLCSNAAGIAEMNLTVHSDLDLNKTVSIALRPEKILINRAKTDNSIHATVNNASFVGSSYQYILNSPAGKLYVISGDTNNIFKVGEDVYLNLNVQDVKILID